ncbi:hypothetical protein I0C86_35925 [Plantactinospora sp. S1510]|uniref:DDE domain-containing protein n=1 Tax=Plantactinospora alkalitolerans TaxID=2789879 RepID=A0ABS0H740_9ACTN|nr:hypothetical protein [Plantactinospora alkalitolerans]
MSSDFPRVAVGGWFDDGPAESLLLAILVTGVDDVVPSAWRHVEWYANNRVEADHSQLKHRLRAMRGLRTDRTAQVMSVLPSSIMILVSCQRLSGASYGLSPDLAAGPELPDSPAARRQAEVRSGTTAVHAMLIT